MEEKKENNTNTEELKNEATNTVNEVKETIKNVDIKKDTLETKGFIKDFFTKPLETIKEIVDDKSGKFLKYSIIILAIWVIAELLFIIGIRSNTWKYTKFGDNVLLILKTGIAPILTILVVSVIILLFNKNNKKKLTTIIAGVTAAYVPTVMASVVNILGLIGSNASKLTSPFASFCSTITLILTYFVTKDVFGEEKHSDFIKKFVIVEACYYVAYFVFTFLGIYI